MATNKSVNVLAPNGRRQIVKVTPNTTILQILEEVCSKQGLKPEEYDIKHYKTILDTTSTIRFSGIPNNAQLELLEATKTRSESDVTLVVQTEDGKRHMGSFSPTNNIWDVLNKLCPSEASIEKNPVIIYMRLEIYGLVNFQSTTLRSLGLTNGRALFRLIHRSPDELKTQANVSAPLPTKPVVEKPYIRTYQPVYIEPVAGSSNNTSTGSNNEASSSKSSGSDKASNLTAVIRQEKKKAEDKKPVTSNSEVKAATRPEKEMMDVDKVERTNKLSYKVESTDDFVFLGERNAMCFSLSTTSSLPSPDLPDDFFELTLDDARRLLAELKRSRLDRPLQTAAMKRLEDSQRQLRQLHSFTKTVIRVQFPDRTVLQGCFTPLETVDHVMEFVRGYMEEKGVQFYLYTTPPKAVLSKDSRLLELGFVPGALLHYGSDTSTEFYLRKDLRSKMTSPSHASMAASKMRQSTSRPITSISDDMDVTEMADDAIAGPSHYEDYERKQPNVHTEKVPKWFKTSK